MGSPELRNEPRFNLKWKIVLAVEQGGTMHMYHGKTEDLSMSGAAVHMDHNVSPSTLTTVLLLLPPLTNAREPMRIEIRARIVYCVLSSSTSQFRAGLQFIQFLKNDQNVLASRLAMYDQGIG